MRVLVIMPVFNGERYLAEAVESLLAQTFADFQLLVASFCSLFSPSLVEADRERRLDRLDRANNACVRGKGFSRAGPHVRHEPPLGLAQ